MESEKIKADERREDVQGYTFDLITQCEYIMVVSVYYLVNPRLSLFFLKGADRKCNIQTKLSA